MPLPAIAPVTTKVTVTRPHYPGKSQSGTLVMRDRVRHNSERAVRRAGSRGQAHVKLRAAVDTGYMKSKVGHEVSEDRKSVEVYVDGWLTVRAGAFYAIYVEYGTRFMRAQPFFWPGIRQMQREFVEEMRRVFR